MCLFEKLLPDFFVVFSKFFRISVRHHRIFCEQSHLFGDKLLSDSPVVLKYGDSYALFRVSVDDPAAVSVGCDDRRHLLNGSDHCKHHARRHDCDEFSHWWV